MNTTLNVGSSARFTTLGAAITFVNNATIGANSLVTISVADGTYNISSQIAWTTPYGNRIQIIGDTTTPANCILNFNNHTNGFLVTGASSLNINGFTVEGTWSTSSTPSADRSLVAFFALGSGSNITATPNMIVTAFYYPFQAARSGSIVADYATTSQSGDVAFFAYEHGFISALHASCSASGDSTYSLGWCYQTEIGGTIHADNSTATTALEGGYFARSGYIRANASHSNSNTGHGYQGDRGGVIDCDGSCQANSNGGSGVYLDGGSLFEIYYGSSGFQSELNTGYGVYAVNGSKFYGGSSILSTNASGDLYIYRGSFAMCEVCTITGVASHYWLDTYGGSSVDVSSSTVSTPGYGAVAQVNANVNAISVSGGGTYSPTVNTLGNKNANIAQ